MTPKTPEEILSAFEERFAIPHDLLCTKDKNEWCPCSEEHLKSFITESLAAYRLSLLSECLELVEDRILGAGVAGMIFDGADIAKTAFSNFNAANALWRERIKKMME